MFSRSIWQVELIHGIIGCGLAIGSLLLTPYLLIAVGIFILIKELLIDSIQWTGKPIWNVKRFTIFYTWGSKTDQFIDFIDKTILDIFSYYVGGIYGILIWKVWL